MRLPLILLVALTFLFSCRKSANGPLDVAPPGDGPFVPFYFSGAIDSIISFYTTTTSLDSGVYSGLEVEKFEFLYDKNYRVARMVTSGAIYEDRILYSSFYYHGSENVPYASRDSMPNTWDYNYLARIYTDLFVYDNQSRKIRDTARSYNVSENGMIDSTSTDEDIASFNYGDGFMTTTSTKYPYDDNLDTTLFDSEGNFTRFFENAYSDYNNQIVSFYPVENPFSKLNLSRNIIGRGQYFWTIFFPLDFYIQQPKQLFKQITGFNRTFYRHSSDDITNIYCYYQLDIKGRVDGIVIVSYTGCCERELLTSVRFYYHP